MVGSRISVITVPVIMIGVSVMRINVVVNMITIVVTNISINKVLLQFNFEGRKRRAVLYIARYTVPEFGTIYSDHFSSIFY